MHIYWDDEGRLYLHANTEPEADSLVALAGFLCTPLTYGPPVPYQPPVARGGRTYNTSEALRGAAQERAPEEAAWPHGGETAVGRPLTADEPLVTVDDVRVLQGWAAMLRDDAPSVPPGLQRFEAINARLERYAHARVG